MERHAGGHMGGAPGQIEPNKWGSEREWGPGGKCLCWGLVWSTQAKDLRGFHWCVWMSLCHSWESRKGTCGRDQPCTWSPGQGVHSLFVGMLRQQKNTKFEEFTIQLFYERGFNFHSILSKSVFLLYLFIKDLVHIVVLKWYICVV